MEDIRTYRDLDEEEDDQEFVTAPPEDEVPFHVPRD